MLFIYRVDCDELLDYYSMWMTIELMISLSEEQSDDLGNLLKSKTEQHIKVTTH